MTARAQPGDEAGDHQLAKRGTGAQVWRRDSCERLHEGFGACVKCCTSDVWIHMKCKSALSALAFVASFPFWLLLSLRKAPALTLIIPQVNAFAQLRCYVTSDCLQVCQLKKKKRKNFITKLHNCKLVQYLRSPLLCALFTNTPCNSKKEGDKCQRKSGRWRKRRARQGGREEEGEAKIKSNKCNWEETSPATYQWWQTTRIAFRSYCLSEP